MYDEGVIKFSASHRDERLSPRRFGELACTLTAWREVMAKTLMIGQSPELYGGAGYGNVSARVGAPSAPRGARPFLISGTQTGGKPCVDLDDYCVVQRYDARLNRVDSYGATLPSSESMTHGAIYDLTPTVRFVLHGHTPVLWHNAAALGLPTTDRRVAYGTPDMAREVARLYRDSALPERRILAMGGHEDGVVVFGRSADEAGSVLLRELARAYALTCRTQGFGLCSTTR